MVERENLPARVEEAGVPDAAGGYGTYGPWEEPATAGGFSARRVLRAVVRYKWLVLALGVAGGAAAVYASRYLELSYTAEARLWIETASRGDGLRGPIQSPELLQNEAWLELLRSYALLDPVALKQRLYLRHAARDTDVLASLEIDPERVVANEYVLRYSPSNGTVELRTAEGTVLERARHGEAVGASVGLNWAPRFAGDDARSVAFQVVPLRAAAQQLRSRLDARMRGNNFMWITYTAEEPRRASQIVNAVADRYVELAAELKRAKLDELRDILEQQLQFAEHNLREAELALERFRVATITLPTDVAPAPAGLEETRAPVMSAFFDLKMEREALQRDRNAILRVLGQGSVSVDALSAIAAVRQSPELMQAMSELTSKRAERRALLLQYTEEHPLVVRATEDITQLERTTVPTMARNLAGALGQQMAQVDGLVDNASAELRQIPSRVIDQARYRREVQTAENLFNDLRQRYESARLASETTVPDVRVLDPATPPRSPSMDQRLALMFGGLAGSLALGLMLAVGLDRMDPRLRYADQVTDDLGLMVIGAVPSLPAPKRSVTGGKAVVATKPDPQVTEALRAIRLNLMHAYGSAGPMIVTITSPGAGDGKTFMTANLGLSYADLGRRTLVIDGDTRRGVLHRMFALERRPGLTDYLDGAVPLDEIVKPTRYPLVDVIPSGARLPNAPELLSSPLLGDLLAAVRGQYDTILIDSPPLGAGVDPLVLGTLAGNVLLIMRTGNTERSMAEAKLRMLDRLPVRLLGTVLNGFDSSDSYRYYSYMAGYESGADESEDRHTLLQRT